MIKDKLENAKTYYNISERLKAGFLWLQNTDLNNLDDGRYYIDNDNLFANVQTYETKDEAPYEAHRKYIDIQYMVKGVEKVGVTDYKNCTCTEEYNNEKDIEFLTNKNLNEYQILKEGEFLVFFPQDAHQPSLNHNTKLKVRKIIVKVLI